MSNGCRPCTINSCSRRSVIQVTISLKIAYPRATHPIKPPCFREAQNLGYELVLWLDASIRIKKPIDRLFDIVAPLETAPHLAAIYAESLFQSIANTTVVSEWQEAGRQHSCLTPFGAIVHHAVHGAPAVEAGRGVRLFLSPGRPALRVDPWIPRCFVGIGLSDTVNNQRIRRQLWRMSIQR
jgi:hypothetical protein